MRIGLRVNTVFALIVMGIMTVLYFNLQRLGQPEELLPIIRPYYLTALAGMLPVALFNVFSQWSFAINRTGLPTWIILSFNVFNVLGNYALIYGHFGMPEMGLLGAGISTLIARVGCAVVLISCFFFAKIGAPYRHGFAHGEKTDGEVRQVVKMGFPVSAQMTFETASFSGSAIFAGWIGAISLASFQIVSISGMLGFCIYYSIGAAMAIPVSHAAGHADNTSMRRSAWAGYHLILVAMVMACCLFIFGGRIIMGWFTNDPEVLAMSLTLIFPMVLYQLGDATQVTFANALRGTSNVTPMLWIAFVSYLIVGLPLSYIMAFPMHMYLYGIVLSFSVCLMLAAVLYLYYFLRTTRNKNSQTNAVSS